MLYFSNKKFYKQTKMDEKLQLIFKIRPLQNDCISYRSTTNDEYRKMMKQACVAELKNLVNVEMAIDKVHLKMPNEQEIPAIPAEIKQSKADYLLKECTAVEEAFKLF